MHFKRLEWMRGYLKNSTRVLDYGCGSGDFVKFLRSKSIEAYGYEPNYNFCGHDFLTNQEGWKAKVRHNYLVACIRAHSQPFCFDSKFKTKIK